MTDKAFFDPRSLDKTLKGRGIKITNKSCLNCRYLYREMFQKPCNKCNKKYKKWKKLK